MVTDLHDRYMTFKRKPAGAEVSAEIRKNLDLAYLSCHTHLLYPSHVVGASSSQRLAYAAEAGIPWLKQHTTE